MLIDNKISLEPKIAVQYEPFTLEYTYPKIEFYAANEFHHLSQLITTSEKQVYRITYTNYIVFGFFAFANMITLVCLFCFLYLRNVKGLRLRTPTRDSTAMGVDELQYDDNFKSVTPDPSAAISRERELTSTARKNTTTRRPSEIEMFFIKKK